MTTVQREFSPTENLSIHDGPYERDAAIDWALCSLREENPYELFQRMRDSVQRADNGVAIALLRGERPEHYSSTEALLYFDSLSVGPNNNRLLKAEFIRKVALYSDAPGTRDAQGKPKPVIMIASPGPGSSLRFGLNGRSMAHDPIEHGDFTPAAEQYLKAISHLGLGKIAALGFSKGAKDAMAVPVVASAANLDVDTVAAAEHPGVEDRSLGTVTTDFGKAGKKELVASVERSDLDIQKRVMNKRDMARFAIGLFKPVNWYMIRGMGRDTLEAEVQALLDFDAVEQLVLGYGSNSAITKPAAIEPQLARLHNQYGHERLVSVRVEGGDHTWGDQLPLLAQFYLHALK